MFVLDGGEYTCAICGKSFYTTEGGLRLMCAAIHPAGQCCHYMEKEVKQASVD